MLAASKMPSHGNSKYFCTLRPDFKYKKKKNPSSQHVCKTAERWKHDNCSIVQALQDERKMILKSCRHCKSYFRLQHIHRETIAQGSHDAASTRAHIVRFYRTYRSVMATKILQESHRHCKMTAPRWHHTRTTSPLHPLTLRCLRFQKKKCLT